jgi:hypothetical protein
MMLKPWDKAPEAYHLLAIFTGEQQRFDSFVKDVWLNWRGDLDLLAATLPPATLPWASNHNGTPPCAYAVSVGRLPAYYLVGWWIQSPAEWQLFYSRRSKKVDEASEPEVEGEVVPRGLYLPWGCEADSRPEPASGAVLLLYDGNRLELPSDQFRNLFAFHERQAVFLESQRSVAIAESPTNSEPYKLPLRLVKELEHQRPTNPQETVFRLQRKLNDIQEQLDTLLWWCEQPEVPVHLNVYPEIQDRQPGSAWDLRDWFTSAPDHALKQFRHIRLVVDQIGAALHLVLPADFNRLPTANLPRPIYRLSLDWRWQRKGRHVFVPEGFELWPPPPNHNEHIEALMAKCLWDGADQKDTLVLLRTPEGEEYRFAVSGFQPLENQTQALNIQVAIDRAERNRNLEKTNGMEGLLTQVRKDITARIGNHATEMQLLLDSLWAGDRADLGRYREQVRDALNQVQDIREWQRKINNFTNTDWQTWSAFRQEVSRLDQELFDLKQRIEGSTHSPRQPSQPIG